MQLDVLIESLLFYKAVPLQKKVVADAVGCDIMSLNNAIQNLRSRLSGTALTIVETDTDVQLTTSPEVSTFLDAVRRDELKSDIGKAGAETLAIILYREPISRAEIDKIRGVNSSVTIRNLLTRGLIEKSNTSTAQGFMYKITPQLLAYLGINKKQDLPEFGLIMDKLDNYYEAERKKENNT